MYAAIYLLEFLSFIDLSLSIICDYDELVHHYHNQVNTLIMQLMPCDASRSNETLVGVCLLQNTIIENE